MNRAKGIKLVFFIYLAVVIKVIIFKYPWEDLRMIINGWEQDVVWEGLDTANFTLFKTIKMYIDYSYMLNSFENLVGNVVVFIPFVSASVYTGKMQASADIIVECFSVCTWNRSVSVVQCFWCIRCR